MTSIGSGRTLKGQSELAAAYKTAVPLHVQSQTVEAPFCVLKAVAIFHSISLKALTIAAGSSASTST